MSKIIDIKNLDANLLKNIQFSDIFQLEEIQNLQDLFSDAFGVASIITLPDGTPVTNPSNFCRLCQDIIRKTKKGCENCFKSDAMLGRHHPSGPLVQKCLSGDLWDAGASITVGGKHIANWLIGQVRNETVDMSRMMKYADEIGANREDFLQALNEVPVMSFEQFNKVSKMLFAYANDLSEKAYYNLQLENQISEHEKTTTLLHKSEESLSIMLYSIGDGVISTDNNGLITKMNPVAEKLCGWTQSEAIGKQLIEVFNIINSQTGYQVENPVEKVLVSGKIIGLANHTVLISRNGEKYQISDSAAPIKNRDGLVSGVVLVFSDVTEKYEAELKIQKSQEQYRILVENTHEVIYTLDSEGVFTYVSPAWISLLGHQTDQVVGKSFRLFIHPDDLELCQKYANIILNSEESHVDVEYRVKSSDGKWFWHNSSIVPIKNESDLVVGCLGIARDITERKLAEMEIREKEVQYRNLADSGMALIWTSGTDKLSNYFNKPWLNFTGRLLEQELGNGWTDGIHPDDFDLCVDTYANAFDKKESFSMEYRMRHFSGEYRWLLDNGIPNFNADGDFIGYIGHCFDISKLKQAEAEIRQKNDQLVLANAEKDKFFSIIAHDLRSPFNSFLGLTQIMAEELPRLSKDEIQEIALTMRHSATNLFRLLENLLHWASINQGLYPVELKEVLLLPLIHESLVMIMDYAKNKDIKLLIDVPENLALMVDENILQAVIRNLVSNAVKFTPRGGDIHIAAKVYVDKTVEISVKDSGIGMSRSMVDNLFKLDVKTNRKGTDGESSNGLGLLLCKEFIKKHDGKIWVESEPEKGSTFYFTIPYKEDVAKKTVENLIVSGNGTESLSKLKILIAEDDESSAFLLNIAVKRISKEVLNAQTGLEAVEFVRKNPDIDLVLMDIKMPEMDGYEATKQIRLFNKNVIIIAQTAYTLSSDMALSKAVGCNDFITKPINQTLLREVIKTHFKN